MKKRTKRSDDKELMSALFGVIKYGKRDTGIFLTSDEIRYILEKSDIYHSVCDAPRLEKYLIDSGYSVRNVNNINFFNVEFMDILAIEALASCKCKDGTLFAPTRFKQQALPLNQ